MRALVASLAVLLVGPGATRAQEIADHVASDGVTHVVNVRLTGSGQAAGLRGERLLVSGPSHLSVFDIQDPRTPVLLGAAPLGAANESPDVASDGRWAAVAETECLDAAVRGGCIAVFAIEAAPPRRIASLAMNVQTVACVLDCRFLWAPGENAIVDMADPEAPKVVGTFLEPDDDRLQGPCVTAHEVRPGVVMVACDPAYALSTLPGHGGTATDPVVLAFADTPGFQATQFTGGVPHSARWPGASDRFMLTSTETPFSGTCDRPDLGAFVVWDAQPVLGGARSFRSIAAWRPTNGTYVDGRSPYNAVGCSAHFVAEHPAFRDGGLVAVTALENGLRFLQVTAEGKVEERAYFLGAGSTAAVPVWHPNRRIVYLTDYARGLDVLEYSGDAYVPPAATPAGGPEPARPPAAAGPRRFRVLGVIRNERGRATIVVETPGAGRLVAMPRARGARLRRLVARVRQSGLTTFSIVATGRARTLLRRRGRLAVDVRIVWRPRSGPARTERRRVVLRTRR